MIAMGCGSSKEDLRVPSTAPEDKQQPIRKIRTNFSDVNYSEPSTVRRDTVYAPSEIPESRRPTEVKAEPLVGDDGKLSPGTELSSPPPLPQGASAEAAKSS